jgi:hypothetical protein
MDTTIDTIRKHELSAFPDHAPSGRLSLVFLHHSCGGQLLADPGPEQGENCIYQTSPNGGGLRTRLTQSGYEIHEAAYGSRIGQDTDVFHWWPKFRDQMDDILACRHQDERLEPGVRNQIVVFKSCFPNNWFESEGVPPGDPRGPELTVSNARAAYRALLEEFRKLPQVLFICVTPPPVAFKSSPQPLWKQLAKELLGRSHPGIRSAALAREFNNWLKSPAGWLQDYPLPNVAVFDYYDLLTDEGKSNFSAYPTGDGSDSHPSTRGNQKAAEAFVPFLNRAVRRANLARQPSTTTHE